MDLKFCCFAVKQSGQRVSLTFPLHHPHSSRWNLLEYPLFHTASLAIPQRTIYSVAGTLRIPWWKNKYKGLLLVYHVELIIKVSVRQHNNEECFVQLYLMWPFIFILKHFETFLITTNCFNLVQKDMHVINTLIDSDSSDRVWMQLHQHIFFFNYAVCVKVPALPDLPTYAINIDTVILNKSKAYMIWHTYCCLPKGRTKTTGVRKGYVLRQSVTSHAIFVSVVKGELRVSI